jgi:hypothetical protein
MTTTQLTPEEKLERRRAQQREYSRKWRENNRDYKRASAREYYEKNHETILEKKREYREDHREEARERSRQWRLKNTEYNRQAQKQYRKENKESVSKSNRAYRFKKKYNLTVEEAEAILARGCEICGIRTARLCVDHCHQTGRVRGCLCIRCNTSLGTYEKKILPNLDKFQNYLLRSQ